MLVCEGISSVWSLLWVSSSPVETLHSLYLYVTWGKRIEMWKKRNGNEVQNYYLGVVSDPFGSRGFRVVVTLESHRLCSPKEEDDVLGRSVCRPSLSVTRTQPRLSSSNSFVYGLGSFRPVGRTRSLHTKGSVRLFHKIPGLFGGTGGRAGGL